MGSTGNFLRLLGDEVINYLSIARHREVTTPKWSGRWRRLLSSIPHRSGRAEFPHPALHIMASLQDGKQKELDWVMAEDICSKVAYTGPNSYISDRSVDQATSAKSV